jgi:hypothetical protein
MVEVQTPRRIATWRTDSMCGMLSEDVAGDCNPGVTGGGPSPANSGEA